MTPEKPVPKLRTVGSTLRNLRLEYLLAGVTGGVTSTLILHPLDLVKVRFQVNEGKSVADRPQYKGITHALRTVAKTDGLSGLYRGVTPNMWGAGVSWGLYFFLYNNIKRWMQNGDAKLPLSPGHHLLAASLAAMYDDDACDATLFHEISSGRFCSHEQVSASRAASPSLGGTKDWAGISTLGVTNPLWVTKTRMCLQYEASGGGGYPGMWSTLRQIYIQEGIRGWYRGFVPGVFGVSHGALQFMAYDEMKNQYNHYHKRSIDYKLSTAEYITFAALSKMFAVTCTYPYQVVRSRLQDQHRQYSGVMDVINRTWRHEGWLGFYKGITPPHHPGLLYNISDIRFNMANLHEGWLGFYKGITPNLLRVTPACCITFLVYETIVGWAKTSENTSDATS